MKQFYLITILIFRLFHNCISQGPQCVGVIPINTPINNYGSVANLYHANNITIVMQNEHKVYSPAAELEQYKQKLESLLAKEKLIDSKEKNLQKKEQELSTKELKIVEKENNTKEKITSFENQINHYRVVFENFEEKINTISSDLTKEKIQEAKSILIQAKGTISSSECIATDYREDIKEFQDEKGVKIYGFPIEKLRNDPTYRFIGNFKEGLARIKRHNVFGYIGSNQNMEIDYQYDNGFDFNNGKAIVTKYNKGYIIDKFNKRTECGKVNDVIDVIEVVKDINLIKTSTKSFILDNECNLKSKEYDEIIPNPNNVFIVTSESKKGVISSNGNVIIEPKYSEITYLDYMIQTKNQDGKIGFSDKNAKVITEPIYETSEIYEGKYLKLIKDKKIQIIDLQGKKVLPFEVNQIEAFDIYGLARFKKGDYWGLANRSFKIILDAECSLINSFQSNGISKVNEPEYRSDDKCKMALINTKGEYLTKKKYCKIDDFNGEYAKVYIYQNSNQDRYFEGLVNTKGEEIIPPRFEGISNPLHDLIVISKQDSTIDTFKSHPSISYNDIVFDLKLKKEVLPIVYSRSSNYWNRYGLNCSEIYDNKIMFIPNTYLNHSSSCSDIPIFRLSDYTFSGYFAYDILKRQPLKIPSIREVYFTIIKDKIIIKNFENKLGVIAFEGEGIQIIPFEYDTIRVLNNNFIVSKNRQYGIIDTQNNLLIDIQFDDIKDIKNKFAVVEKVGNQKKNEGVVNFNNALIIPPIFDKCSLGTTNIIAKKDNESFSINYNGDCTDNCQKYKAIILDYYSKNK